MSSAEDRFARQAELVPYERLRAVRVSVIGVGAIGRQVAVQAASLGVAPLQLVDFDAVEAVNITTQGYRYRDLGATKIDATRGAVLEIDPAIEVEVVVDRFRPVLLTGEAIFCCVDSIGAREAIWRAAGGAAGSGVMVACWERRCA